MGRHPRVAGRPDNDFGPSPLDTLERAFLTLCTPPAPLVLAGRQVDAGWPDRDLDLAEVRDRLQQSDPDHQAGDAAWRLLVGHAQHDGPAWVVGAAGVALPGLRAISARLARQFDAASNDDCDAEVLAGFVTALRSLDPDAGRLQVRLHWAAFRAGWAQRAAFDRRLVPVPTLPVSPHLPALPYDHPDLVLVRAVARGVIRPGEAELIGRTRLGGEHLVAVAAQLGENYDAIRKRRRRAEARLAAAIRAGELDSYENLLVSEPNAA